MDDLFPAEVMPGLYRDVLDVVARLERAGERTAAYQIRRKAYGVYCTRWDEGGQKALRKLASQAQTALAASPRAAAVSFAHRSEPA